MTVVIDDFVMLGKSVPEPSSDGRIFVCSAGVSPTLRSLIRIYPLARANAPRRWHRSTIHLERNPRDDRHESFSIAGERHFHHETINGRFTDDGVVPDHERAALLSPYVFEGQDEANRLQMSLAVIHPAEISFYLKRAVPDDPESPQLALFDLPDEREAKPTARFEWVPRLIFRDGLGTHDLQLRDWGAYELMRKHGYDYAREHLAAALHLRDDTSLLIGNQANRRTSWLVISVFNGVRAQPGLFDRLPSQRPSIPVKVRRRVWERDKGRCQVCGKAAEATDHIWPAIRGGQSTDDNLQLLCRSCNLAKTDLVVVP